MSEDITEKAYSISPSQAVQLMALAMMLKERDLCFRGDETEDEEAAAELIADIAQELAIQTGIMGDG